MQVYVGAREGDTGALLSRNDRVHDCRVKAAVYPKIVVRKSRIAAADGTAGLLNAHGDIGVLLVRWPLALIQVSRGDLPGGKADLRVSTAPSGVGTDCVPVGVEEREITPLSRASRGECDYEDGCCYTYSKHSVCPPSKYQSRLATAHVHSALLSL